MIRKLLFVLAFCIQLFAWSQTEIDKRAIKLVEKSDDAVAERDFRKARDLLYSALQRDSSYAKAYERLFTILRVLNKSSERHQLELRYVNNVNERFQKNHVWQSMASYEFKRGNYIDASRFIANSKSPDSVLAESIKFGIEQSANLRTLDLQELPPTVNKLTFQYLPVLTLDGNTLIFTGLRDNNSDEDIFISKKRNGQWSDAEEISAVINSPYNEGACSITADGRLLIFTACEGRKGFGNCDLYVSKKTGDDWSPPKNLGSNINSRYWDSQPSISADGKTLYFVSNRPGGIGGRDIWVSKFVNGNWGPPENIGKPINSKNDETTPFIYSNNQTLFFSSNGHVGMGGFDLYSVEKFDDSWKNVHNLGSPINTYHDEVSLFIAATGDQAFFTKEKHQNGKTARGSIVTYNIPPSDHIVNRVSFLTGKIYDKNTNTPINAELELIDLNNRGQAYSTESDPNTGEYFLVLPTSKEFGIFVEHDKYLPFDLSLRFRELQLTDTLDIPLTPLSVGSKIVLNNIYFESDSDRLSEQSVEEISRIAEFLKSHETIEIEISGHTDSVGSNSYNHDLSQRRAMRVYDQLISAGISKTAMVYVGKGSFEPVATNSSEAGRKQNRRIEFKVLRLSE